MKPKMIGKIAVDLAMTVLLLLLMAKQLTGDVAHEWLGAGTFVLWIAPPRPQFWVAPQPV